MITLAGFAARHRDNEAWRPVLPVLYSFRRCPYAMRARLAMVASGERCELREVELRAKPPALLAASPKGTVPVLVTTDGTVIDQSLDIMLWTLRRHDPLGWLTPGGQTLGDTPAWIAECDGGFKSQLDRYKYPGRFALLESEQSPRALGASFLLTLERRLEKSGNLTGRRPTFADAAVLPFVRQFSMVEPDWFAAQPWPRLRTWLLEWTGSALFATAMRRHAAWVSGEPGPHFPGD